MTITGYHWRSDIIKWKGIYALPTGSAKAVEVSRLCDFIFLLTLNLHWLRQQFKYVLVLHFEGEGERGCPVFCCSQNALQSHFGAFNTSVFYLLLTGIPLDLPD